MMFLVIFGSLAAAMAVVAQSNLRTADSSLKLSRAMSAAETGMVFARRRLAQESSRFVVDKGVIDADFGQKIWLGSYTPANDGNVTVLPPTGYSVNTPPAGVIQAIRDAHLADSDSFVAEPGDSALPEINTTYGSLTCRPIKLSTDPNSPYFRLKYELLSSLPYVRVTSKGVDGDISRELQMDFKIDKKIEFAVLSPNRIMIGKNVLVQGPLGSRYGIVSGELASANGDPLVLRSDFHYLSAALDTKLNTLYAQVMAHDVDGDGRLRPDHPVEKLGLNGHPELVDYDGDQYVSDFDLFLAQFDANGDKKVCYDAALAAAAGHGSMSAEFTLDNQLSRLIDKANPDRDGDGVPGTSSDIQLGYNDGILDINDEYAKVTGRLAFSVARNPWETANGGSYQSVVQGPVRSDIDVAPVSFEVTNEQMREITTAMFNSTQSWFKTQANAGQPFATQVASGGTYTPASAATWESVPYGATGAYDYYQRPIYSNYTFKNLRIPKGTNALFNNCKFVGVTYVQTQEDCGHYNWNTAGDVDKVETPPAGSGIFTYPLKYPPPGPASTAIIPSTGTPVTDTRVESNNVRFNDCTFLGSISGDKPVEYTHYRNKLQMTGTTRFYIDPNDPDLALQSDKATLISLLNTITPADRDQMAKSSILMPGWSIDVGNFTNQQNADPTLTPKVKLKGTIIAGILDVRGTADVFGTLLMTFRPTSGVGPLYYGGLTDAFNTTIGYFGPLDGDSEGVDPANASFQGFGEITLRYDPNAKLPDGIPWPIRIDADPTTYTE